VEKELCGGEVTPTTNNRMELTAPIRALDALTRPSAVDLHTDSTYVRNGIMSWIAKWKRNGWRTADGQPVKNEDLWRQLDTAVSRHEVAWHWVKGHAGHAENERADRLAARGLREALEAAGVAVPAVAEPAFRPAAASRGAASRGAVGGGAMGGGAVGGGAVGGEASRGGAGGVGGGGAGRGAADGGASRGAAGGGVGDVGAGGASRGGVGGGGAGRGAAGGGVGDVGAGGVGGGVGGGGVGRGGAGGALCRSRTKSGKPCPIVARPSGLCHVHDPAVLCGAPTKRGAPCGVATGGGRCATHS
jgi:ribonuclease HI